jgi:hypothetical protein
MRRRASQRPRALPLNDRSILRRLMLTATATATPHAQAAAHPSRRGTVVCLFGQQCHRPHLRRDHPHVCAATAGLRDGVLRRLAGAPPSAGSPPRTSGRGSAHAHRKPRRSAHAHWRTHTRTHAGTQARTNARAALQRRAPRRVHSAHAIRRSGTRSVLRYSK